MDILKKNFENQFSPIQLQQIANKLDRYYKVSLFWDGWDLLTTELLQYIEIDINELKSKHHYREIYNYVIMNYGKTEKRVKYFLTEKYLSNLDEVCFYEFNVGKSRLDFGRINGYSYAYEIKTELDNTNRLINQIEDYKQVFDYINVVVHPKHTSKVKKMIPRTIGIVEYIDSITHVDFKVIREAKKNNSILKTSQLDLMNSKDLEFILKYTLEVNVVPELKDERYRLVRKSILKSEFNNVFKEAVKNKNQKKWKHIKDNFDVLMPIEIQKVYTNEIDPKYVLF